VHSRKPSGAASNFTARTRCAWRADLLRDKRSSIYTVVTPGVTLKKGGLKAQIMGRLRFDSIPDFEIELSYVCFSVRGSVAELHKISWVALLASFGNTVIDGAFSAIDAISSLSQKPLIFLIVKSLAVPGCLDGMSFSTLNITRTRNERPPGTLQPEG
jgi:hypothetical protein